MNETTAPEQTFSVPHVISSMEQVKTELSKPIKSKKHLDAIILAAGRGDVDCSGYSYVGQTYAEVDQEPNTEYSAGTHQRYVMRSYPRTTFYAHHGWEALGLGISMPTSVQAEDVPAASSKFMPWNWWAFRDYLRVGLGIWEPAFSYIASSISAYADTLPHTSLEDNNMVSYTPDRTAGEYDKQLRTTPEKYLRKALPMCSDQYIRQIAAEWLASRDPRFNITWAVNADGTQNTEAFLGAACGGPGNDASCMRHEPSNWDLRSPGRDSLVHPMEAYIAPGFHVATRRTNIDAPETYGGDVQARAICWANPADASDKRYVRLYPTNGGRHVVALEKALVAAGYKKEGFAGATLQTIVLQDAGEAFQVAAPYLDGVEGPSRTTGGRYLVLSRDMKLRIVDSATAQEIRSLATNVGMDSTRAAPQATTTSGKVWINFEPTSEWVDALSGQTISYKVEHPVAVVQAGVFYPVAKRPEGSILARFRHNGSQLQVRTTDAVFTYGGYLWVDNEDSRKQCGFVHPDASLYPDESGTYVAVSEGAKAKGGWAELTSGQVVKVDDCVQQVSLVDGVAVCTLVHKSQVIEGSITLHRTTAHLPMVAAPNVETVKTSTGRRVVISVHDVAVTYNGSIELSNAVEGVPLPYFPGIPTCRRSDDSTTPEQVFCALQDSTAPRSVYALLRVVGRNVARRGVDVYKNLLSGMRRVPGTDGLPRTVYSYSMTNDAAQVAWLEALQLAEKIERGEHIATTPTEQSTAIEVAWVKCLRVMQASYDAAVAEFATSQAA